MFYGVSNKLLATLQSIQNCAAKIVVGGLKYDHISPILRELHWLPVHKRIVFKLCVMTFKCLNGLTPQYLADKCIRVSTLVQSYRLRSIEHNVLVVPLTKLKIGSRDFAVSDPTLWNALPKYLCRPGLSLLGFRNELKTYLYSE